MNTVILAPDQRNYLKCASVLDTHQKNADQTACHIYMQRFKTIHSMKEYSVPDFIRIASELLFCAVRSTKKIQHY